MSTKEKGKENQIIWREPAQRRGAVRQRRTRTGKTRSSLQRRGAGDERCGARPCRFKILKGTCHAREESCGWVLVHLTTVLLSQFAALGLHTFGLPSLRMLTII